MMVPNPTPLWMILFFNGCSPSETVVECLNRKVSAHTLQLLESSISTEAMYATLAQLASVDAFSDPPHLPHVHLASDHIHDASLSHVFNTLTQHSKPMSCIIYTGASMCFAKTTHPSIMDWSVRPLDKPIRIQQGSGSVVCSKIGIAFLPFTHALHARDCMILTIPTFLIDTSHSHIFLLSTSVLRATRIQLVDSVDAPPFLFIVPPTTHAVPQQVEHLNKHLMSMRVQRDANLLVIPLADVSDFENHISLITALPFSWDAALAKLTELFPPLRSTPVTRPSHVADSIRPKSLMHRSETQSLNQSSYSTRYRSQVHHAPSSQRLRLGLVCAGVVSERVFIDLPWFAQNFEIVLICERDSSKLALARSTFPDALFIGDARTIPRMLRRRNMKLDVIMASFPCTDETPLRMLNLYPTTHTADLFRGDLRFEIMSESGAQLLIEENVPSHAESWTHHERIRARATEHGLYSITTYLDAASVGAATSRIRWFNFLSVKPLSHSLDLAAISKLSSTSTPVKAYLSSPENLPSNLWITDVNVDAGLHSNEYHSTNWHRKSMNALTTLRTAMRAHAYPNDVSLWPHLHEQICVLAFSFQSPVSLGLDAQGHLTPDFGCSRFNARAAKLWFLLHNAFAGIDVFPVRFVIDRHPVQSGLWQTKVEDKCIAMLRCGYHTIYDGTTDVDEYLPHGTPVKLTTDWSGRTITLSTVKGVIALVSAIGDQLLRKSDVLTAQLINQMHSDIFLIDQTASRPDMIRLHDPENMLHSPMISSLAHPVGFYTRNAKGLRACSFNGPIRTVTSDLNELVRDNDDNCRYLTLDEVANITAPTDVALRKRWTQLPFANASKEIAGMIPQQALAAVYRSAAVILGRHLPASASRHTLHLMAADLTPTSDSPDVHTASALSVSVASPRAKRRPKAPIRMNPTLTPKSTRNTLKLNSSKKNYIPRQSQALWPSMPRVGSAKFRDQLYRTWYLIHVFPVNPANLEHLIQANPGIGGVLAGASRYLPFLPIDPSRLKHAPMPARSHHIETYSDHDMDPPGSSWVLDVKTITVKSVLGSLPALFVFVESSSGAIVVYPSAKQNAEATKAAISFFLHTARTHYRVKPRFISSDAAHNLNASELDHWKLQNDLTFSVIGRGRQHFTSLAERAIARLTPLANIAAEGLRHTTVLDRQVRPEAYSPFSFAYAARVIVGLSASPMLLRTSGITVSPFKFLAQRQDAPFPMIPFGTTVWYPSMHPSKENHDGLLLSASDPHSLPSFLASPPPKPAMIESVICKIDSPDNSSYMGNSSWMYFFINHRFLSDLLHMQRVHRPKLSLINKPSFCRTLLSIFPIILSNRQTYL